MLHCFFEAHSFLFLLQESADKVLGEVAVFAPCRAIERRLTFDDVLDGAGVILRLERCGASEHLEYGDAQCPKIDPLIVATADVDLRCLVEMRTNYSKHVSPTPPLKGLLTDAEINDLHSFGLSAIENILGLDISMANIAVMQILDRGHQLLCHQFHLLLIGDVDIGQAGLIEALHDQIRTVLLQVEVESFIADNGRMSQFFQIDEIAFQFEDVLLFELKLLGGEEAAGVFVFAFVNACIGAFSDLLEEIVFLEEGVRGRGQQFSRICGVAGGGVVGIGEIFQQISGFFFGSVFVLDLNALFAEEGNLFHGGAERIHSFQPQVFT